MCKGNLPPKLWSRKMTNPIDWKGNKNIEVENSWKAIAVIQVCLFCFLKKIILIRMMVIEMEVSRQIEGIFEEDLNSTWK